MFDWRRYRGLLVVGAAIMLGGLAVHVALTAAVGPVPLALIGPQTVIARSEIEDADRRIAGVTEAYRRGEIRRHEKLCVFTGLSTALEGIDPEVLADGDGLASRWVGLCGGGGSMEHVARLMEPLLLSDLKPDLVLVAVHPSWLVGNPVQVGPSKVQQDPWGAVRHLLFRKPLFLLDRWWWVTVNRIYVTYWIRNTLYDARSWVFRTCDLSSDAFRAPDDDPFRPPARLGWPEKSSAEFLQQQISSFEGRGWFDPAAYEQYQPRQAAALEEVIAGCLRRGSTVIVVEMPETEALRSRIPPEADRYLRASLARAYGDADPVIWDLRDALPDAVFSDYCHVNDAGRAKLSRILAERVRRHTAATD